MIAELAIALADEPYWSKYFRERALKEHANWALHVAVFQEPFLKWVIEGRKRVESRFSQHQVAPYGEVSVGDTIALKKVGGPIVGVCLVNATWSYKLDAKSWVYIRDRFAPLLCVYDEDFWTSRQEAQFATLMSLDQVCAIDPINYPKNDRRGWVVERSRIAQQVMDL